MSGDLPDATTAAQDLRIEEAESRTEQAQSRTEQAEARTEQAKTRTEQAEMRTEQAETRTEEAKTRTEQAEMRSEQAETRSEKAIRDSEVRYRRLYETALDGILILDAATGQVMDANPFMKDLLGYSQEEFLGKKLWEIGPFKGEAASKIAFAELQRTDRLRYEGLPLETKEGKRVEVEFISNAYLVDQTRLIQCNIRDITERKKAEQQLRLLNTCISNLNEIVLVIEVEPIEKLETKIVFVNEAFERVTGYTSEEAVGRNHRFLQGDKTDPAVAGQIDQALTERRPIRRQIVNYKKDGSEYWMDIDVVPILDPAGKCTHFVAIERDITEAKKSEEQLLWRTAFFEAQVNSALDGILIVDGGGKKILQNEQMDQLWNIPQEFAADRDDKRQLEWVTKQVKDPIPFAEKVAYLRGHPDKVSRDEIELLNGKFFDRYSAPVRGKDGKDYGRIWAFRDITERKRNEARFRRLVNSNAQGVIFWNTKGEITVANDAFLRIVRYTREDLEAGGINLLMLTPPEYTDLDRQCMEDIAACGTCTPYEKEFIRKDKSRVPILLGAAAFEDSSEEGVSFVLDLTERKKLEHQFLRAQRMESIGTLAGGIAHDLNNILAPIMMSIDILKSLSNAPQAMKILDTIQLSAKRGADIVRQVLSFARGLEGQKIEVQPKHLLKDLENIIKDTFPKDIRMEFAVPNDTWTVLGDPTQVHQILLNLCVNARDAMPHGGNLTVGVENCVLDQYTGMSMQAKPGRYVVINVTDSGTGIPAGLLDKIFEPFFTTKEMNKGTGLGLSTVMAIVKSHDGIINVYSEPGKGTTFKVYLPAMELSAETQKEPAKETNMPRGHGETILVVDDEASILIITGQTLQAFGYQVLTATDGAEAVAIYAQHKNKVSVVVTDMMMPIMDGATMIRALTRINPAVKIIAASGLSSNGSMTKIPGSGVKHFLLKPYTAEALLKGLRTILEEN
jgi:PAS domain S-box-containing protein